MSKNLNRILYDINLEIHQLAELNLNDVRKMYYNKWLDNVNNQYLIHSKVIKDLIMMKEGLIQRDFDNVQCDFIINFLCTL